MLGYRAKPAIIAKNLAVSKLVCLYCGLFLLSEQHFSYTALLAEIVQLLLQRADMPEPPPQPGRFAAFHPGADVLQGLAFLLSEVQLAIAQHVLDDGAVVLHLGRCAAQPVVLEQGLQQVMFTQVDVVGPEGSDRKSVV